MSERTFKVSPAQSLARMRRWVATHRWRAAIVGVALVAVLAGLIVVINPFGSPSSSNGSVTDNEYPTSTTTVQERSLTSQTSVSATLGYAGSYSVVIPTGLSAASVSQAKQTEQADAAKVAQDQTSLANAKALSVPENASTLLTAKGAVATDTSALSVAKKQLSADEQLGCPPDSSATVTTPVSGSSNSGSPSSSGGSPSSSGSNSPSTGSTTPSGNTGTGKAHVEELAIDHSLDAPIVATGSASSVTSTDASLSGTVDPDGLSTYYEFEYGTTSAYGSATPSTSAGSGTSATSVSANITGLTPDTTYDFVLVATNADGTSVGSIGNFQTTESSCAAQKTVIATDASALSEAKNTLSEDELGGDATVTSDQEQLLADEATAQAADQALSSAESQSANSNSTVTKLPAGGNVISRGQSVYSLNEQAVPLFYGTTTLYRALYLGVSPGPDVTELQRNLAALGFGSDISGSFTAQTEEAVKAWQASLGASQTGVVSLGDVVLEPGPIEVDTVAATVGESVASGTAILTATSTTRVVTIALDADQQSEVNVGDPVTVTLPDNSTTPGVVSSVGSVATSPSSGGGGGNTGGSSSPTITVEVTLTNPKATGNLDQAPVEVAITNGSVSNALVVPVDALLALSSGGYALEEVGAGGSHHLIPVTLGLFDDADGLVQVSGSEVAAGQTIVIPNT